jgi:hypothetical protein
VTNETAARPATLMQLGSCNADGMILGVGSSVGPGGKQSAGRNGRRIIIIQLLLTKYVLCITKYCSGLGSVA